MNIESKLRPIYIAKILLERTDEDHVITTNELIDILEQEYKISAHRTTIGDDIKVLEQVGLDVETIRSTQNRYHILSRTFDIAELKLLIDAVESSKFITDKKSTVLIQKLQKQASICSADALKRNLKACSRFKPDNEDIFYIADTINTAINAGKKISFQYYYYNIRKEKKLKNGGRKYIFSPYYSNSGIPCRRRDWSFASCERRSSHRQGRRRTDIPCPAWERCGYPDAEYAVPVQSQAGAGKY